MSKEIAQAVSGNKKFSYLLGLLAAIAVLATVGGRWWESQALFTPPPVSVITSSAGTTLAGNQATTIQFVPAPNNGANGPITITLTIPTGFTANGAVNFGTACGATATGAPGGAAYVCVANPGVPVTGNQLRIDVPVTVTPQANGTAETPLVVSGTATDGAGTRHPLNLQINAQFPNVTVTKAVSPGTIAAAGGAGTYTITVTNTDGAPAGVHTAALSGMTLGDTLPSTYLATATLGTVTGLGGPACAINNMVLTCTGIALAQPPDALTTSGTIQINFTTKNNIAPGTVVSNHTDPATAADQISPASGILASSNANFTVSSIQSASLTITPTISSVTATPPQSFGWIYTVTNTGTAPLTNVAITDATIAEAASVVVAPAAQATLNGFANCNVAANAFTGTCIIGSLAAGSSASIVVGMSTVSGSANGVVNNSASVNATELAAAVNATGNVTINNNPILAITKSFSTATVGFATQSTYKWRVTNVGLATANNVVVTDAVPAGLTGSNPVAANSGAYGTGQTCTLTGGGATTLLAGQYIECTVTVVLTAATTPAAGSVFQNTASVVSTEMPAAISATAVVNAAVPSISVTKSSNGTVSSSSNATFTITVTNNGSASATNVVLTDTLPAGLTIVGTAACSAGAPAGGNCNIGTLAAGASATMTVTASLTNATTAKGVVFTNSVTATADNSAPANASSSVTVLAPTLSMTKSSTSGGTGTFTIVVTNSGNAQATGVAISDALDAQLVLGAVTCPAGFTNASAANTALCNAGTIAAGATATMTVAATPAAGVANGTVVSNTATLTATNANSTAASGTFTVQAGGLSITKTNNPTQVVPGGNVTSTIIVTNNGAATVNRVGVIDTLPTGASFVSVGSTATCVGVGATTTLTAAAAATTTLTVANSAAFAEGQTISVGSTTGLTVVSVPSATSIVVNAAVTQANASTVTYTGPANSVTCVNPTGGTGNLAAGASATFYVVWTTPVTPGVVTNNVKASNNTGIADPTATASVQTIAGVLAELKHVNEAGNVIGSATGTIQDVFNNVRGARHTACLFTDGANEGAAAYVPFNVGVALTPANINITTGGGYKVLGDQTPSFSDPQFFTGTVGQSAGATCFSWTSSGAGDQEISVTVVVNGATQTFDFDTDRVLAGPDDAATGTNYSLVKEWNVLETSSVTGTTFSSTTGAGTATVVYNKSIGLTIDPATGLHRFTSITVTDSFLGSHITRTGGTSFTTSIPLVGVVWNVTLTGCGIISTTNTLSGTQPANGFAGVTVANTDGTVGNQPSVVFSRGTTATTDCNVGSTATIIFTGQEPGTIGSGPGVTVTETINIGFTQSQPNKQVLLAWAGQRVVVEHDWRIAPGDVQTNDGAGNPISTAAVGVCPWTGTQPFLHVKAAEGPGNWVQALGSTYIDANTISVSLTGDTSQQTDAPVRPQDACITRAIYESEDQGEVDIEAFPNPGSGSDVGKWAVIIYYMKINTVNLSAVSQMSKPSHNSSSVAPYLRDYSGIATTNGNPWDASKDSAGPVDWNVSKDLLIRGRVTGWFTNSNPSGRARDDSNKSNVLPADRWVMPDDWQAIAGGALASTFRASYDLMFAPNNAVGLALITPQGTGQVFNQADQFATVSVSGTGCTTTLNGVEVPLGAGLRFSSTSQIGTTGSTATVIIGGTQVAVRLYSVAGTTYVAVTSVWVNGVQLPACLSAAPAVGTPVFLTAVQDPFVGPYSLIDIPGFSNVVAGANGAALNNGGGAATGVGLVGGVTRLRLFRDTTKADGVVDMWDAPMPPAEVSAKIRGTGFIKEVFKEDVYYNGTPNTAAQVYPNPYYYQNIPASPYQAAVAAGGGFMFDSWGADGPDVVNCVTSTFSPCSGGQGPYHFWVALNTAASGGLGANSYGAGDSSVSALNANQLAQIKKIYGDNSITRDFVMFSDNHGEFMFTANGDFMTDLSACATNVLAGGRHCKPGDKVGVGTISAVADYPDFVKHFPVASNSVVVNWTWGGYKDVTVEPGETDQYKYVVFHGMDRDGFCSAASTGAVLLHPLLSTNLNNTWSYTDGLNTAVNQAETVDFLIDSGSGIILSSSVGPWAINNIPYATESTTFPANPTLSGERGNVIGVATYSIADETAVATGKKTFPLSSLAASGQTDECQAWIKISNSLLGQTNVLVIAHDDEGNIGFDKIIDLTSSMDYTLNFRWSLITWEGADNISVADALKGGAGTKNPGGKDITSSVTAVYGWAQDSQTWLAFFPSGVNVPGANNLTSLKLGQAYWVAITGPGSVTWTVTTNVN